MMIPSVPHSAVLTCHPGTSSQVVRRVGARVWWEEGGAIALSYTLKGDLSRLRIPAPRTPRRADHLWQHTCFEAFISVEGSLAYHEFNFAPSCEWAAYAFRRYCDGAPLVEGEPAPAITVRRAEDGLEIDAVISPDFLPAIPRHGRLRLALSAVVEEEGGKLSYWALRHPPGNPDFHHPDAFALEISTA